MSWNKTTIILKQATTTKNKKNETSTKTQQQFPAQWYQARADRCRLLWHKLEHLLLVTTDPQQQERTSSAILLSSLQQRVDAACQRSDEFTAELAAAAAGSSSSLSMSRSQQEACNESVRQLIFGTSSSKQQQQKQQKTKARKKQEEISIEADDFNHPMEKEEANDDNNEQDAEEKEEEVSRQGDAELPGISSKNNNADADAPMLSPEDLQAQQREQMEEAIRQMAQQMKRETARIHDTLKTQNATLLEELEQVTTETVQDLTKVTQNVTDHLQQTAQTSMATWTLLFVMVGVFLLTLVTIVMAPKRHNVPCLFFCGGADIGDGPKQPRGARRQQPLPHLEVVPQPIQDPLCTIHRDGTRVCRSPPTLQQQQQSQQQQQQPSAEPSKDHYSREQKQPSDTLCELEINGECIIGADSEIRQGADAVQARVELSNPLSEQEELNRALDDMLTRARQPQQGSEEEEEEESRKLKEQEELDRALDDMLRRAQEQQQQQGAKDEEEIRKLKEQEELDRALDDMLRRAQEQQKGSTDESPEWNEQGELDQALDDMLARNQQQEHGSTDESKEWSEHEEEVDRMLEALTRASQNRMDDSDALPPTDWNLHRRKQDKRDPFFDSGDIDLDKGLGDDPFAPDPFDSGNMVREQVGGRVKPRNPFAADPFDSGNIAREKVGGTAAQSGDPFAAGNVVHHEGNNNNNNLPPPFFNGRAFSPKDVRNAASQGNTEELEGYLSVRPDFGTRDDNKGWTAWHLAAQAGRTDVMEVLIRLSGMENSLAKNVDGKTARDIAMDTWGEDHAVVHLLSY